MWTIAIKRKWCVCFPAGGETVHEIGGSFEWPHTHTQTRADHFAGGFPTISFTCNQFIKNLITTKDSVLHMEAIKMIVGRWQDDSH